MFLTFNICLRGKPAMKSLETEERRVFFSKMGPNSRFWSQKSHFGLILFLNGEMLKPINWRNGVFCPTADPPLSHCQPTKIFRYLLVFQRFPYFWSHFLINFYKLMYAGMQKYSWNMQKICKKSRIFSLAAILLYPYNYLIV